MESVSTLKLEALAILDRLTLMELLQPFGEAQVVGSVALDLLVKLDIDIHLLVNAPDLLSIVDCIYHSLFDREHIHEVRITDYRKDGGVKLGIDAYPGASGNWSIDIWVTDHPETTAFSFTERLMHALQPEHREIILRLKQYYHQAGLLRDGLSLLIYKAVVEQGVRTIEEFQPLLGMKQV